jgi:hypothetical protein
VVFYQVIKPELYSMLSSQTEAMEQISEKANALGTMLKYEQSAEARSQR